MATKSMTVRLEEEAFDRLDRLVASLNDRTKGLGIKRSDALRIVLETGLAAEEEKLRRPSPKP